MTENQGPAPGTGGPVGDAAGAAADAAQDAAAAGAGAGQQAGGGLDDMASGAKKSIDGFMDQLNQPNASGSSLLQGTPPVAGPMGLIYGDVLNRSIAYIIDAIIIGIITAILSAVVGAIFGPVISFDSLNSLFSGGNVNWLVVIIDFAIGLAVSVAYFVYLWTSQRATLGMRVMSLQVGNETNGATLGRDQALMRWALLFGPAALSQAFWPVPLLGMILGLASFVWFLVLLFTTWSSPTKQGIHDKTAHTMVVKSVRTVT
jgi:uncharacterized RDD family membrane protein YckC